MVDFRPQKTMWTKFIWNKYCKIHRPQVVEWKGESQTWSFMLQVSNYIDQEIWWSPSMVMILFDFILDST